jgi:serine/threonine protein kinase
MRYLPESLQSLLKKTGALPIPRLATIAHGIALGLIYLHRLKIIHRVRLPSPRVGSIHDD